MNNLHPDSPHSLFKNFSFSSVSKAMSESKLKDDCTIPFTFKGTQSEWEALPSVKQEAERAWETKVKKYMAEEQLEYDGGDIE